MSDQRLELDGLRTPGCRVFALTNTFGATIERIGNADGLKLDTARITTVPPIGQELLKGRLAVQRETSAVGCNS